MHFYTFHIGDYSSHTSHLSPIEDVIYRRLLDKYYLSETPIPLEIGAASRLIGMREYQTEVEIIIKEFFTQTELGWINKRVDAELAKYHAMQAGGKKGNDIRWGKDRPPIAPRSPPDSPPTPNHIPVPEPVPLSIRSKTIVAKSNCNRPEGVLESLWEDFITLRKAKKAPLTASALKGIEREAKKAGMNLEEALYECCARGWTGFKAEWIKKEPFDVGSATRKILERELEKEARLINPWDSKEIQ
jgi:uncharacterized protein YdaU (DUF1376 family)